MFGTMLRAIGISATAPGATKPVCMSTTSSAVLRASIVGKGCTRPRRRSETSIACCAISIWCSAAGLDSGDTFSFTLLRIIAAHWQGSELEHDLAEMLALAHVSKRGAGIRPREHAVDHGPHPLQRDGAVHVLEGLARSDGNAPHHRAAVENFERVYLTGLASDVADHVDLAAQPDRLQRLHE